MKNSITQEKLPHDSELETPQIGGGGRWTEKSYPHQGKASGFDVGYDRQLAPGGNMNYDDDR